nr:MAG TPA: hypothetical protein [Caudoviricetes sp.]
MDIHSFNFFNISSFGIFLLNMKPISNLFTLYRYYKAVLL